MEKNDLQNVLYETLVSLGGSGCIVDICKHVWETYQKELIESGTLLYTWQYDIRWAATALRKSGVLIPADQSPSGLWELKKNR